MCKGSTVGKWTLKCTGQLLNEMPYVIRPENFYQALNIPSRPIILTIKDFVI